MTPSEYIKAALRTEKTPSFCKGVSFDNKESRLIHASLGMQTEAAEFADMLKKHLIYGKPLDLVNLQEELGDQLWYIALAMDALGFSFEEAFMQNIAKLIVRFPDKFTEAAALERNLAAERAALEKKP